MGRLLLYPGGLCVILWVLPFIHPGSGREVRSMTYLVEFLIAVGAQVVGHFLCKWLDPDQEKGE